MASLPAWECGLKLLLSYYHHLQTFVTPCVGVWIEILIERILEWMDEYVTPCVGVWIEIKGTVDNYPKGRSHSLRGSVD